LISFNSIISTMPKFEQMPRAEKPVVEFEEIQEPEKFDVGKTLEKPGFLEYLQRQGANPETLTVGEIEKQSGAFETAGKFSGFYVEDIQKNTGIELGKAEVGLALENHFAAQKDSPGYAKEMSGLLKECQAAPQRFAEKEQALSRLLGNKDPEQLSKDRDVWQERIEKLTAQRKNFQEDALMSESMRGWRGFFNYRNSGTMKLIFWIKGSRPMEAMFGKSVIAREIEKANKVKKLAPETWFAEAYKITPWIEQTRERAKKANNAAEALRILEESRAEIKEKMETFRQFAFSNMFEPAQKIIGLAQARLRERLSDLVDTKKKNLKELIKGVELIDKLENADVNYLEKAELAKFSGELNKLIDRKVSMAIRTKLAKIPIGEGGPLRAIKDMEANLEKAGGKELQVSRDLIRKKLEAYIKMAAPPKSETEESFRAKQLAAKCLLIKWGY